MVTSPRRPGSASPYLSTVAPGSWRATTSATPSASGNSSAMSALPCRVDVRMPAHHRPGRRQGPGGHQAERIGRDFRVAPARPVHHGMTMSTSGRDAGPPAARAAEPILEQALDGDSLYQLRASVAVHAVQAGLPQRRTDDLVIAAHELAANVVRHGSGSGRLRI